MVQIQHLVYRRIFPLFAFLFTGLVATAIGPVIVDRGKAQLFVDDALIESSEGLIRILHQPVKDGGGRTPVLAVNSTAGHPTTLEANGTILYDPKLEKHVMFALAYALSVDREGPNHWQRTRLLRYTSRDGLNWVAGDDGELDQVWPRSREDLYDPEIDAYAQQVGMTTIYYDTDDDAYPYKGWIGHKGWADWEDWAEPRNGMYFMRSRDGKIWERGPQIIQNETINFVVNDTILNGPSDVTKFARDAGNDRFLALIKFMAREKDAVTGNQFRSRAYLYLDRIDVPMEEKQIMEIQLAPPGEDIGGDTRYDEYYSSTAWRYGSHWLGILKIWHGKGDYPYSAAGCAFFKLISSRDGLNWKKIPFENDNGHPEVFLANGEEGGNNGQNDGGYMTEFGNGPIRIGDELVFYYGASSYGKNHTRGVRVTGGGIFRSRLRVDGFVSVDDGALTTLPMQFEGEELMVNSKGEVTVEVLDSTGNVLGSARVKGDSIRHKVRFNNGSVRRLAGQETVKLRFKVDEGSELYSFSFE